MSQPDKLFIGYHYTPRENWLKIKDRGLLPVPIGLKSILEASSETEGSWLFQNQQEGRALFSQLMYLFVFMGQLWEFVELEVIYTEEDCLKALTAGETVTIKYKGWCKDWVYHDEEPITMVSRVIPAGQIRLLRAFDLHQAIQSK